MCSLPIFDILDDVLNALPVINIIHIISKWMRVYKFKTKPVQKHYTEAEKIYKCHIS